MSQTNQINFNHELRQLEDWQRHGRTDLVVQKIKQISRFKIPREFLASFAELAYRANLFSTALLFLNTVIRADHAFVSKPSDKEKLFYAASLVGIGATQEATDLFNELNSANEPEVLLYHSFALFGQWKYKEAIPFLKKFISLPLPISEYRRLVGKINLAAAYIVEQQHDEAMKLINDCIVKTDSEKLHLLHGNCLELQSQIANAQGDYDQAMHCLFNAQKYLNQHHGRYHFFIDKGLILTEVLKSKGSPKAIEQLRVLKQKAYENQRWETVRDCDLYEAMFTRCPGLIAKLYRGTPYQGYRLRLQNMLKVTDFEIAEDVQLTFNQNFFSNQIVTNRGLNFQSTYKVLNLDTGLFYQKSENNETSEITLETTPRIDQFFKSLMLDFYKPMSIGSLFSTIYPEEYYNTRTSPARIFSLLKRLNFSFKKSNIPIYIESEKGYFLIKSYQTMQIFIQPSQKKKISKETDFIKKIHKLYGPDHFSVKHIVKDLHLSKTAANQVVQLAVRKNILTKLGNGRSSIYRFCRRSKVA